MPVNWNGISITGRAFHPYGQDAIVPHQMLVKSDIVISLLDAWVFDMNVIRQIRWVPWFPVDSDPIPPEVLERVRYAFSRLVYSKFAKQQLETFDVDCHYVPHGTDTKVFNILPSQADARRVIGLSEMYKDAYMVGMVAANKGYPSRKAFEQNIAAFKMLNDKHKDTILFLQTWSGEGGQWGRECVNLVEYCRQVGLQLGKNVFFCDQFANVTTGFPDSYMVSLYNAMDVLLSVSRGEGFGIPILEAQSCGTPVITGDWTSMSEITFSGWKVDKSEAVLDPTWQKTWQYLPRVEAIAERLESAYQMRGNQDYQKRARKGAEAFDVNKIAEKFWKPALDEIAGKIEKIEQLKASISVPSVSTENVDVREVKA